MNPREATISETKTGGRVSEVLPVDASTAFGVITDLARLPGWNATMNQVVELPDGSIAILGQQGILVSKDQGETWKLVTKDLPFRSVSGILYSKYHKAFYGWQFTCEGMRVYHKLAARNLTSES